VEDELLSVLLVDLLSVVLDFVGELEGSGLSSLFFFPSLSPPGGLEQGWSTGISIHGKWKVGIPGILKEILGRTLMSILIQSGNLGIQIIIDPPPQSEHQIRGKMISLRSPFSVVVVVVHVLAVILLPLMSSVLQPVGILVTTLPESVEKNGQMGVVIVGAGLPRGNVADVQSKRKVVVSIAIPPNELGSGHLGSEPGEAVDESRCG
jgi:hypothetical protein